MEFKNLSDLNKYLMNKIAKSMYEVGEHAEQTVKEQIDIDVYSYQPSEYERTFELRDSVIHTEPEIINDLVSVEVKHDTDLIHPNKEKYQHYSAGKWEPKEYNRYVAQTVHDGTSGHLFGEGFWTEPRPYMDHAKDKIKNSKLYINILKDNLRKQGLYVD
jgi:hypothetical protein